MSFLLRVRVLLHTGRTAESGGAQGGRDLGGVAGDGFLDQAGRQAAPVDMCEDPVQAQGLDRVEELAGDLASRSDHDRALAAGACIEGALADHEAASARGSSYAFLH